MQTQLPKIGKSSTAKVGTYSYTYADLASIHQVVLPLLGKNGLSWLTMPTFDDDGHFVLRYELLHVSGESRIGHYPLPASTSKAQELGSAITYGRRYTLSSVVGIAPDDDDDGAAAQQAPPQQRRPKRNMSVEPSSGEGFRPALDVESVRAALTAAGSLADLRELWPDAKAAGLQQLWKDIGASLRGSEATADERWSQIIKTVPPDWPMSKVEEEFASFTGVSAEKSSAEEMEAFLAHLAQL